MQATNSVESGILLGWPFGDHLGITCRCRYACEGLVVACELLSVDVGELCAVHYNCSFVGKITVFMAS